MAFLDITRVFHPFGSASTNIRTLFMRKSHHVPHEDQEDARNRGDFIRNMIFDNHSSFSNEYDVQQMMHHFPRDF